MRCKKCLTEINVPEGVVGITPMGPSDKDLKCLNKECDGVGYSNFESTKINPVNLIEKILGGLESCPKCLFCGECKHCNVHSEGSFGSHKFKEVEFPQ